jgi:hypothetical protein
VGAEEKGGKRAKGLWRRENPCLPVPKEFRRASASWAEPKLIAAIRYATRTIDGYLRHPVFEELMGLAARKPKE